MHVRRIEVNGWITAELQRTIQADSLQLGVEALADAAQPDLEMPLSQPSAATWTVRW